MQQIQVNLPKLGESILSATIVHWFKKEGDLVRLDEPLLEVATDKINSEIPAPCDGIVVKIHAQNGQELKVGELLVTLQPVAANEPLPAVSTPVATPSVSSSSGAPIAAEDASAKSPEKAVGAQCPLGIRESFAIAEPSKNPAIPPVERAGLFAGDSMKETYLSPAVMRLAKEYSLPLESLLEIEGKGEDGRITKKDVEDFIKRQKEQKTLAATAEDYIFPLSPLRKIIAENMERSYKEIPHAYLVQEIDVTLLQDKIRQMKEERSRKKLPKLTLTAIVMHALGKILQKYPLLNSSFAWDGIRVKKSFNCGMAVSVEQGVLVPVVKNVQALTLDEVALEIQTLAEKARGSKLAPDLIQGGTFTLTNFGMSGIALGFPIIKAPEAAILALGALQNKVIALTDRDYGIREMMQVTLAFDHRIFDGIYACQFLKELQTFLERPFDDSRISL